MDREHVEQERGAFVYVGEKRIQTAVFEYGVDDFLVVREKHKRIIFLLQFERAGMLWIALFQEGTNVWLIVFYSLKIVTKFWDDQNFRNQLIFIRILFLPLYRNLQPKTISGNRAFEKTSAHDERPGHRDEILPFL